MYYLINDTQSQKVRCFDKNSPPKWILKKIYDENLLGFSLENWAQSLY